MEREEKLEVCYQQMSEEFGITERQAFNIVFGLEIEDVVLECYSESIERAEQKQMEEWEEEIEMNSDLYSGDIHGGV